MATSMQSESQCAHEPLPLPEPSCSEPDEPQPEPEPEPEPTNKPPVSEYAWDPLTLQGDPPSRSCLKRIKSDLKRLYREPLHGICVSFDQSDITRIHALVTGPEGTPYEYGLFHFFLRCPPDYPNSPPRVKLLTTDGGRVRFNPNLYANGKVCLSILGTWSGPGWSPAQWIGSVLLSVQTLLGTHPYHNEPGYEKGSANLAATIGPRDAAERYNSTIRHETLRVAVARTVEMAAKGRGLEAVAGSFSLPPELCEVACVAFAPVATHAEDECRKHALRLDGEELVDLFNARTSGRRFAFAETGQRLNTLRAALGIIEDGTEA